TGDRSVLGELDDAERGVHLRDDDRRRGARPLVVGEQSADVDVEQLVAVEREHRPALAPPRRREPKPPAPAERLLLPHRLDLGPQAAERVHERVLLPGAAGDDDARHAGGDEPGDRVLGEREARHGHERLRQPLGRLPEALRLSACEQESFHQPASSRSSRRGSPFGEERRGRPIPSYSNPAAIAASGSSRLRPSMMSGFAIASRTSSQASSRSSGHSVTTTAASAPRTASSTVSQSSTPWRSSGRATGSQARTSAPSASSR